MGFSEVNGVGIKLLNYISAVRSQIIELTIYRLTIRVIVTPWRVTMSMSFLLRSQGHQKTKFKTASLVVNHSVGVLQN